ncbi:MAG: translation initiation factor IF-2 [Phycisphaerales bacterium]|nr:translation initiation factor IF-2 [Phycisphaerales bacterium]
MAKDLGVTTKDIIEKCIREGVEDVTSPQASIPLGLAETIKEWFGGAGSSTSTETAQSVDVAEAKKRAEKLAPKRKGKATEPRTAPEVQMVVIDPIAPVVSASNKPVVVAAVVSAHAPAAPVQKPAITILPPRVAPASTAARVPHSAAASSPSGVSINAPTVAAHVASVTAPAVAPARPIVPAKPAAVIKPAAMNVPTRPVRAKPTSEMLAQPTKTSLSGPKVIRIDKADVLPVPRPRFGAPMGGPTSAGGAGVARPGGFTPGKRPRPTDAGRSGRKGEAGAGVGSRSTKDLEERTSRIAGADGFFRKHKPGLMRPGSHSPRVVVAKPQGPVKVPDPVSVKELSALTGIKVAEIMKKFLLAGNPITINSALDGTQSAEVMMEFSIEIEVKASKTAADEIEQEFAARERSDERARSAVVTILGHVDHGKTTLLDRIRSTNIAAGEAGGITQSTRAFQVEVKVSDQPRTITFIDTPGHEAFTAMRARGAKVTDVVVLVIDAVDGVMPQTIESINHIKAAKVAVIVALNKIDRPEFDEKNLQRIYGELAKYDLNPVPWGGSVEVALVSGLKGTGLPELLELIALQADVLELKADWGGHALGTVLEARMEEGRGAVAQLLVQEGVLKRGDFVVVGRAFGRVRDIVNDRGVRITSAEPTATVAISGMDLLPDAGDKFYVVESLAAAELAAKERRALERDRELSAPKVTLDNIFETMANSKKKELPLVVKGDVQGSVETLKMVLGRIKAEDVSISIKHAGVGGINESDIELAATTGAVVVGFNVTSNAKSRQLAEARKIDIRLYEVIYQLTDDMEKAVRGLLEPEVRLQVLGHADVRAVYKITKVGAIAGCYVTDGVVERNAQIRVTRDGIVVEKDRRLEQLKRFKEDAREVRSGNECGMKINGYDDIREGDVLECYRTITVRPLGGGNA